MGRGGDGDFAERDRRGARNFAEAAGAAGVERIVYLGGLGEGTSAHLRSRQETAESLALDGYPADLLPRRDRDRLGQRVAADDRLPGPPAAGDGDAELDATRTQPIAAADVVAYLAAALDVPGVGRSRDRDRRSTRSRRTAACSTSAPRRRACGRASRSPCRCCRRRLSSHWIGLVTPVDAGVARPLVEGLTTETVVTDPSGMELFDVEPTPIDVAHA